MRSIEYPLAFGHWHVRGDKLACRMPRRQVEVRAPGPLLAAVLRACTGRLHWKEVAAQLATRWDSNAVDTFLGQLARAGVLVEASEALACWSDVGQLPAPYPRISNDEEVLQLPKRAHARLLPGVGALAGLPGGGDAFAKLLKARQSHRTFDDRPITAAALGAVLWAAHGVARASPQPEVGWHRTVASGGNLHSARWFVFVLRALPGEAVPAVAPGVYEARFHVEGGVTLEAAPGRMEDAWRVLVDPRVLTHASALMVPVYDVSVPARKYGNRATLFACIEAGESLQNAQLMAAALGIAACMRGDTSSGAVLEILRFPLRVAASMVMPSLVVGSRPTAQQVQAQVGDRWLQVSPLAALPARAVVSAGDAPCLPGFGFGFAAGPILEGEREIFASGRAADPCLALDKAQAEAWERQGWAALGPVVEGRRDELPAAIDPATLVAYSATQYHRPGFPFCPFSEKRKHLWREAMDVRTGRAALVLADCVHALSALPPRFRERAYTSSSTSGVAAWTDPEGALCRATLELIERDAFLRNWLPRQGPELIELASLPAGARKRVEALQACGHRVEVAQIGIAFVPVFAVFVQSTSRPFTAITAAAHFDAEAALGKALDEAEGRVAHAAAFPAAPMRSAREVQLPADIDRYYQTPRFHRRSDFFASAAATQRFDAVAPGFCRDWDALKARLHERNLPLLAVDLTPPGAAIRQSRQPLYVTRAFVPGLLPIWFGYGLQPAGLAAFGAAMPARGRATVADSALIHPFT